MISALHNAGTGRDRSVPLKSNIAVVGQEGVPRGDTSPPIGTPSRRITFSSEDVVEENNGVIPKCVSAADHHDPCPTSNCWNTMRFHMQ